MRSTNISLTVPAANVISSIVRTLRQGGVVLSPTDTIYGLACDPFQRQALEKVVQIKGRQQEKGFLLLIAHRDQVRKLVDSTPASFEILSDRLWPGPVTMLFRGRRDLPALLLGKQGKIGFRVPDSRFLQAVLQEFSSPLLSTSANLSGQAPPEDLPRLRSLFSGKVDLFVDGGPVVTAPPSTVLDLCGEPPQIVRRGARDAEVEKLLARMPTL